MSGRGILAVVAATGALALALGAAPAGAIRAAAPSGARPQLDLRGGQRAPVPTGVRDARQALARRLGIEGHLDTDPVGGGVRVLDRTNGFLSGPRSGDPAAVALAWVREHADVFGLTPARIDALALVGRSTSNDGVTHLTWVPTSRGIPAYDSELRVHVTRDGRVLTASGPPLGDLAIPSATPALTASQALAAAQNDVGAQTSVPRATARPGVQRQTAFADGDSARLVVFDAPSGDRLAWRVTVAGKDPYWFDEVVDATTGAVLVRHSLTRFASNALVYDYYPGAPAATNDGGSAHTVDISRWLTSSTRLLGPNAHAYADVNNNDTADSNEEIPPSGGSDWLYSIRFFPAACAICTWDETDFTTESTNRDQATTQVFYYVNTFHDWLAQPAVGFTSTPNPSYPASGGNFEGSDRVLAEADDSVLASPPNGPNFNNANMTTYPDGRSPRMQMYLFDGGAADVNGGDDASVVYHEYTHGLSNRLIDDASGLNESQGQAMGEGWSDWYAMDYLVANDFVTDTSADGEVRVGEYVTGNTQSGIRFQPLDCSVGSSAPNCPGTVTSHGPGGFTFADLGRVGYYDADTPRFEVHDDGEVWSETLWDLRKALDATTARQLITDAMRLSPADPSYLDERDMILAADEADDGGAHHAAIWQVFANRGMGYGAVTTSPNATRGLASFATPSLAENGGVTVSDPAPGGDGDGIAESGETVGLTVTLDNPGLAGLTNVHGTLSASTPGVTVSAPEADFGSIAAGATAQDSTPYTVAIGRDVGCGSLLTFTLHVTSDQGSADVPVAVALGSGSTDFSSSDVPKTIVPGDPISTSAVSTLTVPTGGRIDHLRVTIDATHDYVGGLRARLTSPSGTTVDLLDRPSLSNNGFGLAPQWAGPITFDDAASQAIQDVPTDNPSGTLGGSYVPDEPLAALAGEDRAGEWTLRMTDEAPSDGGTLNGWSIESDQPGCTSAAVPPIATTGSASGVTQTGATLAGTIDAGSAPTTYRFDYGTTAAYGQATPAADAGSAMGAVAQSGAVSSLSASTLYHFRIVALRGGVPVAFGADQTFTTAAVPAGGGGSTGAGGSIGGGPRSVAKPTGVTAKATLNARNAFVYAFRDTPGLHATIHFTLPKHGRTKAIAFGARSFVVARGGRVRLTIKVGGGALAALHKLHTAKVAVTIVLDGRAFRFTLRLSAPKPRPQRRR